MDRKYKVLTVFISMVAVLFYFGHVSYSYGAEVIQIGMAPDLTGPTSEVGIPYNDGIKDYFRYINDKGGVHGKKIKLKIIDCQKVVAQEVSAYKKFTRGGNTPMVFTWDTGGAMTIAPMAAKDKVVHFAGSLIGQLGDAAKRPYSFLAGTSYQRQIASLVNYALIKFKDKGRKPTFAITYPKGGYGKLCLAALKQALDKKGLQLVQAVIVPLRVLDAKAQMSKIKKANPDFVVTLGVEPTIVAVMKEAQRVGISLEQTQFLVPINAIQKNVIKLGGDLVESLVGATPYYNWDDTGIAGIQLMREINKKYHPEVTYRPLWYTYGFVSAMVVGEGLQRIPADQAVSGANLKKALETLENFDAQGIASPFSYTASDHSGPKAVKLISPNVKKNTMEGVSDWVYAD